MMKRKVLAVLFAVSLMWSSIAAAQECTTIATQDVAHVDMEKVRTTWLGWVNRVRTRLKLPRYSIDVDLNQTASNWSLYSSQRGFIDHKRYDGSPYYDYKAIEQWFAGKGLTFSNIHSMTFTENIGWGPYSCSSGDCTAKLMRAIRSTFMFYLAERGKKDHPHYSSLINPEFTKIGVGIAIDEKAKKYYLTVHYATNVTAAAPFCTEKK